MPAKAINSSVNGCGRLPSRANDIDGGADGAEDHLPLTADVEQPCAGGDHDGKRAEQQRRRPDQRLADSGGIAERRFPHGLQRVDRIGPLGQQERGVDQERASDRHGPTHDHLAARLHGSRTALASVGPTGVSGTLGDAAVSTDPGGDAGSTIERVGVGDGAHAAGSVAWSAPSSISCPICWRSAPTASTMPAT